jgi:hypothetical protein
MMKVELFENVGFVTHGQNAPRNITDLNGVAIIGDVQRDRFVVKLESRQSRGSCTLYVNGGLPLASGTCGVGGIQLAPVRAPSPLYPRWASWGRQKTAHKTSLKNVQS